jgi:plasmid stabilization system protein ParE
MKVLLSEQAKRDMKWWRTYYRQTFPVGGPKAATHMAKAVELLAEHSHLGSEVEGYNLRRFQIHKTPFALIYRVKDEVIEIARVWDGRKDPKKLHANQ